MSRSLTYGSDKGLCCRYKIVTAKFHKHIPYKKTPLIFSSSQAETVSKCVGGDVTSHMAWSDSLLSTDEMHLGDARGAKDGVDELLV